VTRVRLRFLGTTALVAVVLVIFERAGGAKASALFDFVVAFILVALIRLAWRYARRRWTQRRA